MTNWWMKESDDIFDYSIMLLRIESLYKNLHDACLNKHFEKAPTIADDLIEQAVLLKKWVKAQK